MVASDSRTARFSIEQVRAGSSEGFAISGLVDIRVGEDVRFLEQDKSYIVGAAPLGVNQPLGSVVRQPLPIFGGNSVIELGESSLECPTFESPIQILHLDGRTVETGVLEGVKDAKSQVARALLLPIAAAFGIIIALVAVRWLFTGIFSVARSAALGESLVKRARDLDRELDA